MRVGQSSDHPINPIMAINRISGARVFTRLRIRPLHAIVEVTISIWPSHPVTVTLPTPQ
jgi:hypothetical protein